MGIGIEFTCNKCGHDYCATAGIGFRFPSVYQETVEEVKNGKHGEDWKKLFESTPGAAINAEKEFYVCPGCGTFDTEPNLAVYAPKDMTNPKDEEIHEYHTLHELQTEYHLVKSFMHKCPKCGERMHKYRTTDYLRCPECNEGQMEPSGELLWD